MDTFYRPRRYLINAGIVAVLLGATSACTLAQNPQEPASRAQVAAASDAALAARVKAALRAAPDINDTHIDVTVEDGNVVLRGLVEDNRALLDALHVATKAAQGRKVIDALSIIKLSPG
jgi:hyperosmotically inducible protein